MRDNAVFGDSRRDNSCSHRIPTFANSYRTSLIVNSKGNLTRQIFYLTLNIAYSVSLSLHARNNSVYKYSFTHLTCVQTHICRAGNLLRVIHERNTISISCHSSHVTYNCFRTCVLHLKPCDLGKCYKTRYLHQPPPFVRFFEVGSKCR